MNSLVCGQPHCSSEGNTGLELREPRLCWWLLASPTPADQCSARAWGEGSYPLFACGERTISQSWLPEVPSAALLSALLHGELSSCISRRAGIKSQHPSAASCCFILPILYHSQAMLHSTSNYKVKPSQKNLDQNRVEVTAAGHMRATDLGKAEAGGQALGSWSPKLQHVFFPRDYRHAAPAKCSLLNGHWISHMKVQQII